MRVPIVGVGAVDAGRRKLLATTLPFARRGPLRIAESVETKLASAHVPEFHELFVLVTPTSEVAPPPLFTDMSLVRVLPAAVLKKKPKPPSFFHAVFEVTWKTPVWLLSVKPLWAFWNTMLLRMMWFVAAPPPPPSLKPLPSPSNGVKFHRLYPLPHAYEFSILRSMLVSFHSCESCTRRT